MTNGLLYTYNGRKCRIIQLINVLHNTKVGIVTKSSNGFFATITESTKILSGASLQLQRHKTIVSVTSLLLERHTKFVLVTFLQLLTVNDCSYYCHCCSHYVTETVSNWFVSNDR